MDTTASTVNESLSPFTIFFTKSMGPGWTGFDEGDPAGASMELTTFHGTDHDANFTPSLQTLRPSDAGEDLPLSTGQTAIAVVSGIISFVTVVGNLLVLYAFCADRRLRTYINYFIVGLSIADLVAGVFTMPLYTVYWVLGRWPFSAALCDTYLYVNHVFIHISVLGIFVLAIDRYQAVYHPLKHLQKRTLRHASFMISISYIIPFLLWLPYCLLWPYIVGARRIKPGYCYPQYVDSLIFSILAPICFFWIPLPITSVLYWRIYLVIKQKKTQPKGLVMMQDTSTSTFNRAKKVGEDNSIVDGAPHKPEQLDQVNPGFDLQDETATPKIKRKTEQTSGDRSAELQEMPGQSAAGRSLPRHQERRKESHRATRTLTLIFIVLLISSVPWSILVIIYCLCPTCIPLVLYQTSVYLTHMNSTVNPFCYAVANPLYLAAFTRLVRRRRRRTTRSAGHSSSKP